MSLDCTFTILGIREQGSGFRPDPRAVIPDPPVDAPAGFALIDAIIAAAILAVGVSAIAHVFAIGARATTDSRDLTFETVLAMQKLEELRAGVFPDGPVDLAEIVDARGEALPAGTDMAHAAYRRRWTIQPWPFDPVDAVVITVAVSRPVAIGVPVRITTLRTRRLP